MSATKTVELYEISPHIKPGIANPQVSYAWLSCFVDKIIELFHDDFLSVDNV